MIQKIEGRIKFSREIKKYIKGLYPLRGGEWDSSDELNKKIKTFIKKQLTKYQDNKCAYCGLPLNETSRIEIEHIAPKGGTIRPQYPQYAYTVTNLVLACSFCNGSSKKGTFNTIDILHPSCYKNCTFKIVHPYYDNPEEHLEFSVEKNKVIVSYKTIKGEKTIEIFDLNSESHCMARAKQLLYDKYKNDPCIDGLLLDALTYKRG